MGGLAEQIIVVGAVLAAVGVIGKTTLSTLRGGRKAWTEAVEHVMEPHVATLTKRLDDQDAKLDAQGEKLDKVLYRVTRDHGGSMADQMDDVHTVVMQDHEIDRLYRQRPESMPERRQPDEGGTR